MPKQPSTSSTQSETSTKSEPEWKKYLPACLDWLQDQAAIDLVFDGFEWAPVEHAVHELSHAVLLGLPGSPHVTKSVAMRIKNMHLSDQIACERDAWVLELLVAKILGLPIQEGDAIAGAEVQGVTEEAMEVALASSDLLEEYVDVVIDKLDEWVDFWRSRTDLSTLSNETAGA